MLYVFSGLVGDVEGSARGSVVDILPNPQALRKP